MNKPKLYLFIGVPGAGKTSVAIIIAKQSGATHLWADAERHKLFAPPTHSTKESDELYRKLNAATAYLLDKGQSVIFDTNFNFYDDRQKLRVIAEENKASTVLIWLSTPLEIAKKRALDPATIRNGYTRSMSEQQFNGIVDKLEPPRKDEKFIKIDGTKLDPDAIKQILDL